MPAAPRHRTPLSIGANRRPYFARSLVRVRCTVVGPCPYLLKILQSQGMHPNKLHIIFKWIVMAFILYALLECGELNYALVLRGTMVLPRHRGTMFLRHQYRRLYGTI